MVLCIIDLIIMQLFLAMVFLINFYGLNQKRTYYISQSFVRKSLNLGNSTVQDVTVDSCAYCALYSSPQKYEMPFYLRAVPEFNVMSKILEKIFYLKNMETYLQTDEIWLDGKSYNIPQYLLNKYFGDGVKRDYNPSYVAIKRKRMEKFQKHYDWMKIYKPEELWEMPLKDRKYARENAKKRLQHTL